MNEPQEKRQKESVVPNRSTSPQQPKPKKIKTSDSKPSGLNDLSSTTKAKSSANTLTCISVTTSTSTTSSITATNLKMKKSPKSNDKTTLAVGASTRPVGNTNETQKKKAPLTNSNGIRKPNEVIADKTGSVTSKTTTAKPKIRRKIALEFGQLTTGNALKILFFCCCCCCDIRLTRLLVSLKNPGLYFSYKIKITAKCSVHKTSANYRYSSRKAKPMTNFPNVSVNFACKYIRGHQLVIHVFFALRRNLKLRKKYESLFNKGFDFQSTIKRQLIRFSWNKSKLKWIDDFRVEFEIEQRNCSRIY